MNFKHLTYIILYLLLSHQTKAQQTDGIDWISFEQLQDSLSENPKKVIIDFYADWCAYCKKMDKVAFKNATIISTINKEYYAVRMNAESTDTIVFGGDTFINDRVGKQRNATHQIPLLLASRPNTPFSLPAIVIMNKKFEITDRYFEYMSSQKLLKALNKN